MSPFLSDMSTLTLGAAALTVVVTAVTRLCFRRGKGLEEP
jgi:hypothetical protein